MIIKPYEITKEHLISSDFKPIIYLPMNCMVLEFEVDEDTIIMYVEQYETNEYYPRKIAFISSGFVHEDILKDKLVYHSSIKYNNKKYFVYLNENEIAHLPATRCN